MKASRSWNSYLLMNDTQLNLSMSANQCYLESLTPLPCTPAFVLGIVNLRGEIIPVLNSRIF